MNVTDATTRVYMLDARTAHLLAPDASAVRPPALCGKRPVMARSWYGTGNRAEQMKAAALPVCGKCEAAAEQKEAAP